MPKSQRGRRDTNEERQLVSALLTSALLHEAADDSAAARARRPATLPAERRNACMPRWYAVSTF